jgi:hypothetical protein
MIRSNKMVEPATVATHLLLNSKGEGRRFLHEKIAIYKR